MSVGAGRRTLAAVVTAVMLGWGLLALMPGLGVAAAATATGEVYVVHGIVGVPADVLLDGRPVANSAAPKTVIGPLRLPPGNHVVTLRNGTATVVSARFAVTAGTSIDVVAHRSADASRAGVVTVFVNDLEPVGPGKTRLVVSHVAVAPPADIQVDGTALFRNVANGESLSVTVPAKSYRLAIVPTGGGPQILAATGVRVQAGTLTRVFAVGDASANSAAAVVQVIEAAGQGRTPTLVRTGDGGQAAESFVSAGRGVGSTTVFLLSLTSAVALGLAWVIVARRRGNGDVIGRRHSR